MAIRNNASKLAKTEGLDKRRRAIPTMMDIMNYKFTVFLFLSVFFNLYGTHWSRLSNLDDASVWEDAMELEQLYDGNVETFDGDETSNMDSEQFPSSTVDIEMSDSSDMIQMPHSEVIKKKLVCAGLKDFANNSKLPYLLGDESIEINALTATLASTFINNQAHLKFDEKFCRKDRSLAEAKRMIIQSLTHDHQIAHDRMCSIFLQQIPENPI